MKKLNFLSISFLGIIIFICGFVMIKQVLITLHVINFNKSDNWQVVEESGDKIYDKIKSIQVGIENRVNNYFPMYENINALHFNSIMNVDSLYLKDIYLKNNRDNEKVFYNTNGYYYIVNNYSNKELDERQNNQINYFNSIANNYNVIVGLYMPLRYEMNSYSNINKMNDRYIDFRNALNKKLVVGALESQSIDDYFSYFYKSDHHFNSYGAIRAYKDVLHMFNLTDNKKYEQKELLDEYYGSAAKSLLTDKVSDKFKVIDFPNSLSVSVKDDKFKPLKITKKDNKFYDYYVQYFNGQYDEIVYTNNNTITTSNLLIISDSLVWQIDYLLANNFKNTYVENLRYGKWLKDNISLEDYIKNKNITHVLFVMEAEEEMFDIYNFKINERVK